MSRLFLFWVLSIQGVFLSANGLFMLVFPEKAAQTGALRDTPTDAMLIMSMSTMSLGSLYVLGGVQQNRHIAWLSIAGRAVASVVFFRAGGPLGQVGWIEIIFGLITAILMIP